MDGSEREWKELVIGEKRGVTLEKRKQCLTNVYVNLDKLIVI